MGPTISSDDTSGRRYWISPVFFFCWQLAHPVYCWYRNRAVTINKCLLQQKRKTERERIIRLRPSASNEKPMACTVHRHTHTLNVVLFMYTMNMHKKNKTLLSILRLSGGCLPLCLTFALPAPLSRQCFYVLSAFLSYRPRTI